MPTQPIRIFVTSQEEVDQVWLMFCQQTAVNRAEVRRDGIFLFLLVRHGKGPRRVEGGSLQASATPQPDSATP